MHAAILCSPTYDSPPLSRLTRTICLSNTARFACSGCFIQVSNLLGTALCIVHHIIGMLRRYSVDTDFYRSDVRDLSRQDFSSIFAICPLQSLPTPSAVSYRLNKIICFSTFFFSHLPVCIAPLHIISFDSRPEHCHRCKVVSTSGCRGHSSPRVRPFPRNDAWYCMGRIGHYHDWTSRIVTARAKRNYDLLPLSLPLPLCMYSKIEYLGSGYPMIKDSQGSRSTDTCETRIL